jgi:TRAP-type C4-dicarboxylate transport system substrate-binding protein
VIHSSRPVETLEDMQGLKVRGPSRLINKLLEKLGATPVGMPVPAIPEALSKGVIDATVIPWEVTGAIKIPELVQNHTEFEGNMIYTVTFVLAMNKARYEGLPDDLRAVIDANAGHDFSVFAGKTQQDYDAPSRQLAVDAGNNIITITDTAPWVAATEPIYAEWIAEMQAKGIDGQALIDEARTLMAEYQPAD